MKHIHSFETKVFYGDTDAYGVVWHGAYLRWLEMGRVLLCEQIGLDLVELKKQDVVLPVTNLNIRYKMSAKLNDEIIIETFIEKFNNLSVTFKQTIKSKQTGKLYIEAIIDAVAISNDRKLYRRMPVFVAEAFRKELEECPLTV